MQHQSRLSDYFFAVPLTGDIALLLAILRPIDWKPKTKTQQFVQFIQKLFLIYLISFSFPIRMIFRYQHSVYTIGWLIVVFSALNIIFFNLDLAENNTPNYLSPIFCFIALIVFLYQLIFDPERASESSAEAMSFLSPALNLFVLAFLGLALTHIIISYFITRKSIRDYKRGTPVVWKVARQFSRKLRGKEDLLVWVFIETLIATLAGVYFLSLTQDTALGIYLLLSATSYILLELYEALMKWGRVYHRV